MGGVPYPSVIAGGLGACQVPMFDAVGPGSQAISTSHISVSVPESEGGCVMIPGAQGNTLELRYGPGQPFETSSDIILPWEAFGSGADEFKSLLSFLSSGNWLQNLPLDSTGAL